MASWRVLSIHGLIPSPEQAHEQELLLEPHFIDEDTEA